MQEDSKSRGKLRRLLDWFRRRKPEPTEPEDPYAYRLAPVRRGPQGRSGAAVAEPDQEDDGGYTQH